MEIVGADGSSVRIKPGETREFGRSHGLDSSDKTISRRQISVSIPSLTRNHEARLQFEVLGRNPIYVNRNNEVKIFRRSDRDEMEDGDMFCVSAKNPVWYTLRGYGNGSGSVRQNNFESQLAENLDTDVGFKGVEDFLQGDVDISDINPVTEFGFLVIGHEFDSYPKGMIRDIKNLDWFLEEAGRDSEDDRDEGKKGKRGGRKTRNKGTENDDEEWTGESEDGKVLINNPRKAQRPKYMTRSKDRGKPGKGTSKSATGKTHDEEVDDEDENDETLGGFTVDDQNLEEEEEFADESDEDE